MTKFLVACCQLAFAGALALTPFDVAHAKASYRVLYKFQGGSAGDGAYPVSGLIADGAGNLYGMTSAGGDAGLGIVFRLAPDGTETVLHTFRGLDGANPQARLIMDEAGNLYGTTMRGGDRGCEGGCGTVFKLAPDGTETVLHVFKNSKQDGINPVVGLVMDVAGNLYGTTPRGGGKNCVIQFCGTIFKITPDGTETLIHVFDADGDGNIPSSALMLDKRGNFYGATELGGDAGIGTIYKLTPNGKVKLLYSFKGGNDGETPAGDLVMDRAGNFYGTTAWGGAVKGCTVDPGCGTVFKLSSNGTETVLHVFGSGNDGVAPSGLIADAAGNFYGTTPHGGDPKCGSHQGCGIVFQIAPDGTETVLHTFSKNHQGLSPFAGLIADKKGNLFGTTVGGGDRFGTVFEIKSQ